MIIAQTPHGALVSFCLQGISLEFQFSPKVPFDSHGRLLFAAAFCWSCPSSSIRCNHYSLPFADKNVALLCPVGFKGNRSSHETYSSILSHCLDSCSLVCSLHCRFLMVWFKSESHPQAFTCQCVGKMVLVSKLDNSHWEVFHSGGFVHFPFKALLNGCPPRNEHTS